MNMRKTYLLFITSLPILVILVLTGISLWPKGASIFRVQVPQAGTLEEARSQEEIRTEDVRVYENGVYGFRFKAGARWKRCSSLRPPADAIIVPLFIIVPKSDSCALEGEYGDTANVITIADAPGVYSSYSTISKLLQGLEKARQSAEMFMVRHPIYGQVGLFEVIDVKEGVVSKMPVLYVAERSPFGYASTTGIYIFHKTALLRIEYSFSPGMQAEGREILNSFVFTND